MEYVGLKFKTGDILITLDPEKKKVNITGNIDCTAVTGSTTLKPVKAAKEAK